MRETEGQTEEGMDKGTGERMDKWSGWASWWTGVKFRRRQCVCGGAAAGWRVLRTARHLVSERLAQLTLSHLSWQSYERLKDCVMALP